MGGRNILEELIIPHETELRRSNKNKMGVILNNNFENPHVSLKILHLGG
jgi:hypothetical protein